jgi:hypothetical protein
MRNIFSACNIPMALFDKYPHIKALIKNPPVFMSSLFDDEDQADSTPCNSTGFMELLGSLLVHVVKTHANIAYAVRCMAMRAKESTLKDMHPGIPLQHWSAGQI